MTNRPRIDLGLESSSVTLNRHAASLVGLKLARARAASRLSLNAIADRLLLSRNQIRALEDVEPDVFYSVQFHIAALRKYADLLGVEVDGIGRLLVDANADVPQAGRSPAPRRRAPRLASNRLIGTLARRKMPAAIGAGAVVTIVVVLLIVT